MDKLYIQMCREAEEIRESWEPKSGDLYLGTWRYREKPKMTPPYEVDNTVIKWDKSRYEFCFWVPRQEDLQQIFRLKNGNPDDYWILKSFLVWFSHLTGYPTACPDREVSITQLWLQYVMETVYKKRWNGTEWEPL